VIARRPRSRGLPALITSSFCDSINRHAPLTRKAYESDFRHFADWCQTASAETGVLLNPLPAEPGTVWLYLNVLVEHNNAAEYKVSTLERRLSAIKWIHETNGHPNPASHIKVRELMTGIRKTHGAPQNKADALTTAQVAQMVAAIDLTRLSGLRDRALLLFGYAGAFRRSELATLTLEQLQRQPEGYQIHLLRTKDDQEGKGRYVGIPAFPASPLCPVAAVDAWLSTSEISTGPIFRRVTRSQTVGAKAIAGDSVARILKRLAKAAGLPSQRIAGHSLRAGHSTTAAINDAPRSAIMDQTGHKSEATLQGYIRPATVFTSNSANWLGLDDPEHTMEPNVHDESLA